MEKMAESLIETHRNPIVKLSIPGNKIYIPKETKEEKAVIAKGIQTLSYTLKFGRVERRCARAKAIWLADETLVQVLKATNIQHFGFRNKTGLYLYPEEALFLLETNRIEISWHDVPLSVQQGYEIFLGDDTCKLNNYLAYKKLAMQGYKLLRKNVTDDIENTTVPPTKKFKTNYDNFKSGNISEATNLKVNNKRLKDDDAILVRNVLRSLREAGPKKFETRLTRNSSYKIYAPGKSNKAAAPDFNMFVINENDLPPTLGLLKEDVPNLFGIVTPDSVAYYRFSSVNLPTLL